MADERGLHRIERPVRRAQVFDGDERATMERGHEEDARVHRRRRSLPSASSPRTTVQAPQSPSAQPSLVPVRALDLTQPAQHRERRVHVVERADSPSHDEANRSAARGHCLSTALPEIRAGRRGHDHTAHARPAIRSAA